MAILTITELKALWVNGFVPTEDDYNNLFDSFENIAAASGGSSSENVNGTFQIGDMIDGQSIINLIPAQGEGKAIIIKSFRVKATIDSAYSSGFIGNIPLKIGNYNIGSMPFFSGSDLETRFVAGNSNQITIEDVTDPYINMPLSVTPSSDATGGNILVDYNVSYEVIDLTL